jgi:tRNA(Ile)-lysidine synthase
MGKLSEEQLLVWVGDFIDKHRLARRGDRLVIGLSGGKDSMLMGHICYELYLLGHFKSVRFVHIDHGLREESGKQASELAQWCKRRSWPLTVLKVKESPPRSNIELWARDHRRHMLLAEARGELLFLGHHIDDSFEWFMRQLLSSSATPSDGYGIAVKNKTIRRPLHCLSRKHIILWHSLLGLESLKDSSNEDLRYQRNQIRHQILKPVQEIFPRALAHFVEHANGLAKSANNQKVTVRREKVASGLYYLFQESGDGYFEGLEKEIMNTIYLLSHKKRGELRLNVKKLIQAQKSGRRGPLSFSGGVKAVCYPGMIIFYNEMGLEKLKVFDELYAKSTLELKASQIPCSIGPFQIATKKMINKPSLKKDDLFPLTIDTVLERGWWIRPKTHVEITHSRKDSDLQP